MPHAINAKRPFLRAMILISGTTASALGYAFIGSLLFGVTLGPLALFCCGMIGALAGALVAGAR